MQALFIFLALGAEGISLEQSGHLRAAVSIECRVAQGLASGSGTVIGNTRGRAVVVTAAHVVQGGSNVLVVSGAVSKPARVLALDTELDVAILWCREFEGIEPVPLSKHGPPKPGASVEACGFGPSVFWCRAATIVEPEHNEAKWLCTRGPEGVLTVSGDSGGPVFHQGKLAGVIWGNQGMRSDQDRCTMATPAWRVRRLIDRRLPAVVRYLAE